MTKKCECLTCVYFKQQERPIGTCEVTKQSRLAWHGCTSGYVPREKCD